jgi:hypothetical protein
MSSIFYDVMIMGFRVKIVPYKVIIYDDNSEIVNGVIPDNIVRYCLAEGYCDLWAKGGGNVKVEIMRIKK